MIDKNSIVYQLVTDRFDNENGDLSKVRLSKDYKKRFGSYLGGTFRGIERRMSYLKRLGITHLLISPVEDCNGDNSYHGYHPVRPGVINPRFGTPEDLKRLVSKLKSEGISTVLDYIPVHISSESDLFREKMKTSSGREWFAMRDLMNHPVYGEQICSLTYKLTDGNTKVLNDVNSSKAFLGYFGLENLPLFNLYNPEVVDFHIRRLRGLIGRYGFSDIRFDSGFIQPRGVIKKIREGLEGICEEKVGVFPEYWPFYAFSGGECFGFSDGEFNIKGTMLLNNYGREPGVINNLREHYSKVRGIANNDYIFITGLSNHDLPRFESDDETQKMAALLQFTLPAFTPIIFYGEEMPMRTINDGDDRIAMSRDVMPFDKEPKLFDFCELPTD